MMITENTAFAGVVHTHAHPATASFATPLPTVC
mgnify:CR=1 FL=1